MRRGEEIEITYIAGSIDGGTGRLREEKTEESGSLELVTALAASERAVSAVTRSDTVGVRANVSDRSTEQDGKKRQTLSRERKFEIRKLTSC